MCARPIMVTTVVGRLELEFFWIFGVSSQPDWLSHSKWSSEIRWLDFGEF